MAKLNSLSTSRRRFLRSCATGGSTLALAPLLQTATAAADEGLRRPNILFILADDIGFECLSSYGGGYKTPNLDRLAAQGARFTNVFASPVCSPSRIQLMTGQYAFRSGFIDIAGRNGAPEDLDCARFSTLAQILRSAGYATAACSKWHLGWDFGQKLPPGMPSTHIAACGFERQFCFSTSDIRNYGPPIPGKYVPDIYQKWALSYLDSRKGKAEPFFLYYALGLCHNPWMPTPHHPDRLRMPRNRTDAKIANALFADMVEYMDDQVGQILRKLDELGMAENTIVLFSSDNGTDSILVPTLNGRPLPGQKMTLKDRASWVPLLVRWPSAIHGGIVCDDLVDFTDFVPTLADLTHTPIAPLMKLDGRSFAPQLLGRPAGTFTARDFVHVQLVKHYFVRDKRWKLLDTGELYEISGSPFVETKINTRDEETDRARARLAAIARSLHTSA